MAQITNKVSISRLDVFTRASAAIASHTARANRRSARCRKGPCKESNCCNVASEGSNAASSLYLTTFRANCLWYSRFVFRIKGIPSQFDQRPQRSYHFTFRNIPHDALPNFACDYVTAGMRGLLLTLRKMIVSHGQHICIGWICFDIYFFTVII